MSNALGGFLLVFATGICWIAVGISVSLCSTRKWDYNVVQGLNYAVAIPVCLLIMLLFRPGAFSGEGLATVFGLGLLAGLTNFYAYVFTAEAMRRGPNGLVWGIMQAGMIGSFLMGILFFGEKAAPLRLAGLALILGGVLAMGSARSGGAGEKGKNWLLPALGAFLLVMAGHCCSILPSYFSEAARGDSSFRTLSVYTGGLLGFAITTLPGMLRRKTRIKPGEWLVALSLAGMSIVTSIFLFYNGLNILARNGCGGLGYPVAIGVCVTGFSLYSLLALKEKFPPLSRAGLCAVCVGIILIALK